MSNECYVIYAIQRNKETEKIEDVCIISCVDTMEKVNNFLSYMQGKYNAEYLNEYVLLIDDERFPFLEYITYRDVYCDINQEVKGK